MYPSFSAPEVFSLLVTWVINTLSPSLNLWGVSETTVATKLAVVIPAIILGFLLMFIPSFSISLAKLNPVLDDSWRT